MPASWQEMQDYGYVVHSPITGRIMPTAKSSGLEGLGARLKSAFGFSGSVRSGAFEGYQGSVKTRDPYGSPVPMSATRNDLSALAGVLRDPSDVNSLGLVAMNLQGQSRRTAMRGLEGINQERAGRICAATSAVGQLTTSIGLAVSQSGGSAGGGALQEAGAKDPVKGQGTASGWETANNIAGQTDELCSALFAHSGSTPPATNPFAAPGGAPGGQLPQATTSGGFGSDTNKLLLYGGGAALLVGALFLLKD